MSSITFCLSLETSPLLLFDAPCVNQVACDLNRSAAAVERHHPMYVSEGSPVPRIIGGFCNRDSSCGMLLDGLLEPKVRSHCRKESLKYFTPAQSKIYSLAHHCNLEVGYVWSGLVLL